MDAALTLLKHPLTATGAGERGPHLRFTRELELHLRRNGPAFPDAASLSAWARPGPDDGRIAWADWLGGLLSGLEQTGEKPLLAWTETHLALSAALAAGPGGTVQTSELWRQEAGEEALRLMSDLLREAGVGGDYAPVAYADLVTSLLGAASVRHAQTPHPTIAIWGTLEARVQGADLVILGGLNDGVWPEAPPPDPWLSRQMRLASGLLLPERRIGLSAHDFQQAIAAPRVILSRATRDADAQTVPSRWLNRLTNLMGGLKANGGPEALAQMRGRGANWLTLAGVLDAPEAATRPAPRPAPRPPEAARPRTLPVTDIQTLIRDPYAIYAKRILRLRPLDPLRPEPDPRERGNVLHRIVEDFVRDRPDHEPLDDARARLMQIADRALADGVPWPSARRLWRARLDKIAAAFVAAEALRLTAGEPMVLEKRGEVALTGMDFTLNAKPDRIDLLRDGRAQIYDYKSGKPPSEREQRHFNKQLLLEAAMTERGAFKALGPRDVSAVSYIRLGGEAEEKTTMMDAGLADAVWAELHLLIARYLRRDQGYSSRRAVQEGRGAGDYDQLARFGEWEDERRPRSGGCRMIRRSDASEAQVRAAEPAQSTWLSANAGSGKTRVLTDRVARLLLDGCEPQHILCLTYTKAAAAEMQNRLFQRLGEWAMLPEPDLRAALLDLGAEGRIDNDTLARARRLFARAIDTPGGLKIQTIHSFCASLLRRFPLEAGVSPDFREMEDRAAKLMRAGIVEELADGGDIDAVASVMAGEDFDPLLQAIASNRAGFSPPLGKAAIWGLFDLPEGFGADALLAQAFTGGEARLLAELGALMAAGKSTDIGNAARFAQIQLDPPDMAAILALESILLTGATAKQPFSAKVGTMPTKDLGEGPCAHLMPDLHDLMARIEAARDTRIALAAAEKTLALHRFAAAFLPRYDAAKAAHGWLDFDDLIGRAGALLSDRTVTQWVLYRLDGGIDHILVDEAQDTSPGQWKVIERLAEEFTAGEDARGRARTVFVVGDKKQSIYSFQGADLQEFDGMSAHFGAKFAQIGRRCWIWSCAIRSGRPRRSCASST